MVKRIHTGTSIFNWSSMILDSYHAIIPRHNKCMQWDMPGQAHAYPTYIPCPPKCLVCPVTDRDQYTLIKIVKYSIKTVSS